MRYIIMILLGLVATSVMAGDCVNGSCAVKALRTTKTVVTHPLKSTKKVVQSTRNGVRRVGSSLRNLGR
jgi:hypothetical protein